MAPKRKSPSPAEDPPATSSSESEEESSDEEVTPPPTAHDKKPSSTKVVLPAQAPATSSSDDDDDESDEDDDEEDESDSSSESDVPPPAQAPITDLNAIPASSKRIHTKMPWGRSSNQDLISELPVDIRTHILAFLDIKSAVTTTLLSKRWDGLWTKVPNLDFGIYPREGGGADYVDFVHSVLHLNEVQSVQNICLDLSRLYNLDPLLLDSWLTNIAHRKADKINLRLFSYELDRLPDCFFNQTNLTKLELSRFVLHIPSSANFPHLKKVHLYECVLRDEASLKNLMRACPVLRDLRLYLSTGDDELTLYICSPSLCTLDMYGCIHMKDYHCTLVLDTPKLTHLSLSEPFGFSYGIRDVSSLVNASFCFDGDGAVSLYELLTKISSHITELFATVSVIMAFPGSHGNIPVFPNLTHLTLIIALKKHWECLSLLLHCTPKLVTFLLLMDDGSPSPCDWDEPIQVPPCFLSCLESIRLPVKSEDCEEEENEMEMISYFLKHATLLKKMHIVHYGDRDLRRENELLKVVSTLPKSSVACQVYLSNHRDIPI